jgi:N-acetylglucosaminyldiphosphoundecaprenol N-acetyl-beta-D-mannosaminyltransferase
MTPRTNLIALQEEAESGAVQASGQRLDAEIASTTQPRANVLGIQVDPLDMTSAVTRIAAALAARRKGYICVAGVHGIMEAQRDPEVQKVYADAFMTVPDGMPTVWVGRWQGFKQMQRVAGPDLMLEIFQRGQFADYSHFFYGGKPGIAEELSTNLSRRFPQARIVGAYTPPFRDLTRAEERSLISMIRSLKPSIIWVGISTPRQEMFMRKYLPLLDTSLMFGVGAAFDFHTGRIKDCADWVKRAGLQWLHRLMQDPRHLLWRYLRNNPEFIWRIAVQLAHRDPLASGSQVETAQEERSILCDSAIDPTSGD